MRKIIVASVLLLASGPVVAQETVTYTYDALGRLVESSSARGPATSPPTEKITTKIEYDPAGNRKSYSVSGSANGGGDGGSGASAPATRRFVVVPLNGFTIIPIG